MALLGKAYAPTFAIILAIVLLGVVALIVW